MSETGKGAHPMPRGRGERVAANLNKNFPGFEHWLEPAGQNVARLTPGPEEEETT